ncbi:MAG: hypothetical protein J6X99_05485 [Bacteroidales bacterium]|nr:hypothetical protein [Bacteroidales bacterium]
MKIESVTLLIATCVSILSCTRGDDSQDLRVADNTEIVPVELSLGVGADNPDTKGNPAILKEMTENFRGIDRVLMVPFERSSGALNPTEDRALFHVSQLPGIDDSFHTAAVSEGAYAGGLVTGNGAHLYPRDQAWLPKNTASVLAYGRAAMPEDTDQETLHTYGAIEPVGLGVMDHMRAPAEIGFRPVQIHAGDVPTQGTDLAALLTSIVGGASFTANYWYMVAAEWKEGSTSLDWNASIDDIYLKDYFQWITNEGRVFPGAGVNVEYMLTYLYRLLLAYSYYDEASTFEHSENGNSYPAFLDNAGTQPLTLAHIHNGLRDLLIGRIEALVTGGVAQIQDEDKVVFTSTPIHRYPEQYGLPNGSAMLRWNGVSYQTASQVLDGVAPMSNYCYPPALWYYSYSTLSTSAQNMDDVYIQGNTWDDIVSSYRDGKVVYNSTESVALDTPLQYSCGLLIADVTASASILDDGDGSTSTKVEVSGEKFPVTGIIIGGQRSLRYDFTPATAADTYLYDPKEYYLYDNQISGVYLTDEKSASFRCFVSQTIADRNTYFCLELRNDSGSAFVGAEGTINPGAKFYLIGHLEVPTESAGTSVFLKDHTTEVECIVSSLAEAHSAIPDLSQARLTLGIQTKINWIAATSSFIVMY